eukprot:CAMPEP_0202963210 /NCGR_PEP_ID=MMETSP1396-20130829/7204_1 /ASSEMBLY_ACC=CAM_ASM_000872 /TAXON_ID= /ORGANISM="Pseudokeronopsis sp., Strain Brazil" /LENGTH=135 /DNA_ID=CAMNT_0049684237 /DNA_START=202 /DNA_END=606 /DNA_ORIENTATION=+
MVGGLGDGVSETQVHIHYNGWGARWDEWLDVSSPRIAPFRTHTVQNPKAIYLSPFPNIAPDSDTFHPVVNREQRKISSSSKDVLEVMQQSHKLLQDFSHLRTDIERAKVESRRKKREEGEEEDKEQEEEKKDPNA